MYSSFHNQCEKAPVDSWLPSAAGASADVSQPADTSSTLSRSTYFPSHAVSPTTPFNDLMAHDAHHEHPASLRRHLSEPNIQSVAAQHALHYPISNATETRYHRQRQRQQHCPSFRLSVTPVIPSPRFASNYRRDQITSSVGPCHSAFSNPFSEHDLATRSTSLSVVDVDPPLHSETAQTWLHSPPSSLVSIARPEAPEKEHNAVTPDPSKSYGTRIHLDAHIIMQPHRSKRSSAEFKELRKQWRKAKKERIARRERTQERFNMRSEQTGLQYLPQSYERQPSPLSCGRQQFYGPGMRGAELDQQQAVGEAMSRYPLGPECLSMRPQSFQQQYRYTVSHLLYPVVPTSHISSSWPERPTQHEDPMPPQQGCPTPGQARSSAQAAYEYERERHGQSWTPPSLPDSPLSVQPQPLWGEGERERNNEVNEEAEGDKVNEKGEEERNEEEEDLDDNQEGKGEVNDNSKEEEDDVWTYIIVLACVASLQSREGKETARRVRSRANHRGASQSEKPEDVVVAAAANGIRDEIEAEPLQRCREAVQEDKSNDVPPAVDGITGSDEAKQSSRDAL
ncbi:hypothetical protein BJV77DRAFT_966892 [Russula vinacea]|nr:hypothetical protein BJV77DRAFT_966892 [Russula vinacea]